MLNQPTSSPMMKMMLGLVGAWACAADAPSTIATSAPKTLHAKHFPPAFLIVWSPPARELCELPLLLDWSDIRRPAVEVGLQHHGAPTRPVVVGQRAVREFGELEGRIGCTAGAQRDLAPLPVRAPSRDQAFPLALDLPHVRDGHRRRGARRGTTGEQSRGEHDQNGNVDRS